MASVQRTGSTVASLLIASPVFPMVGIASAHWVTRGEPTSDRAAEEAQRWLSKSVGEEGDCECAKCY